MASGSNAPFSGEYDDLENIPTLPEGVTSSEATEKQTVDGETIKLNQNGDLRVSQPSFIVAGDFEQDLGGYSVEGSAFQVSTDSFRGSGSAKLDGRNSSISNDLDLSGVDRIFVYLKTDNNGTCDIIVNGQELGDQISMPTSWTKFSRDVSNFSGVNTVEFSNGTTGSSIKVDFIHFQVKNQLVLDEAGN